MNEQNWQARWAKLNLGDKIFLVVNVLILVGTWPLYYWIDANQARPCAHSEVFIVDITHTVNRICFGCDVDWATVEVCKRCGKPLASNSHYTFNKETKHE